MKASLLQVLFTGLSKPEFYNSLFLRWNKMCVFVLTEKGGKYLSMLMGRQRSGLGRPLEDMGFRKGQNQAKKVRYKGLESHGAHNSS